MANENRPEYGIRTVRDELGIKSTPVRTASVGGNFWESLTAERKSVNEPKITPFERYLVSFFPARYSSPFAPKTSSVGIRESITEMQKDHESCTYIAVANGLRVLDGPKTAYTKDVLKSRLEEIRRSRLGNHITLGDEIHQTSLAEIFSAGQPYGGFRTYMLEGQYRQDLEVPDVMLELLKYFDRGSIGVLAWPYSPFHTLAHGITYEHARTLTGFTINEGSLFFHVIDPYEGVEKQWSFRNLVAANTLIHGWGIDANTLNSMAKQVWLIKKTTPSIRTVRQ